MLLTKKIGDVTKKRSNSGSPTLRYVNIKRARTFQLIILKHSGHCNKDAIRALEYSFIVV